MLVLKLSRQMLSSDLRVFENWGHNASKLMFYDFENLCPVFLCTSKLILGDF